MKLGRTIRIKILWSDSPATLSGVLPVMFDILPSLGEKPYD